MFICICNALRDNDIAHAVRAGARNVCEVYAALGADPQCRCCFEEAENIISAAIGEQKPAVLRAAE